MFTGLIEDVGQIVENTARGNYQVLTVKSRLGDTEVAIGDSISCDGVCLTVIAGDCGSFTVEASQETTARTILRSYRCGSVINLERALRVDSRLAGHFVTGHVDCTGRVAIIRRVGESLEVVIDYDPKFEQLVIEKGSIAINGISLTINRTEPGRLSVNLIPHSLMKTTVANWKTGDHVNLEFDMLGKYILKQTQSIEKNVLTKDKLLKSGW